MYQQGMACFWNQGLSSITVSLGMDCLHKAAKLFIHTPLYFHKTFQVFAKICLIFYATVQAMSKKQLYGVNETSHCSQSLWYRMEADIVLCLQRHTQPHAAKGMEGPTITIQFSFLQSNMSMTQLAGWRARPFPVLKSHDTLKTHNR